MKTKRFQIIEMQNDILNELSLEQIKGGSDPNDSDTCRDGGTLYSCTGGGNLCTGTASLITKPGASMW